MSARRPVGSRPRWLLPAIIVAALAVAGGWYWTSRKADDGGAAFRTAQVERGDIRQAISATGTLSATSTVTVGSQISGQIAQVLVDFNDHVRKGQVLARIDPSTYDAQIAQGAAQIDSARAQLAQAQASLRNAQADFARKSQLGTQKLVSRADVDLARTALQQAQAQVNTAQAQIRSQSASTRTTRVNLERTVIRSPVDGVVLTRKIEPGQTVAASMQAPELFVIAEDLAKMKIELAVDESDIGQVRVGQGVVFTADAFPERQFRGVVDQVRLAATTSSNVVSYPVVVAVDNSDGTLLPGLTVNAEIEVNRKDNVLKLSNAALRFKPAENSPLAKQLEAASPQGAQGPDGGRRNGGGNGMLEELKTVAAQLQLQPPQQAAFDTALQEMQQRQAERMEAMRRSQAQQQAGANRVFGGGMGGGPRSGGGGDAAMQAQMRNRMRERFNQQFGAFRSSLTDAQRAQWDAAIASQLSARRVTVYALVDGKPQPVTLRLGASDGNSTEIRGKLKEGDEVIIGERAASETR